MEFSDGFRRDLQSGWGSPNLVADAALNELFRLTADLDHDEQVSHAMVLGIIAGQTEKETLDKFLEKFEVYLKEEEIV